MIEESTREALGHEVGVHYEYSPDLRKGNGSVTIAYCGLTQRAATADREHEFVAGGEQFRNAPMLLKARYMVSAWAKPPEDQALLGAVLRTFLDEPFLLGSMYLDPLQ